MSDYLQITARDMYAAQGVTLTAEQRASMTRLADRIRAILGTTEPEAISVPVHDHGGALIGYMTYAA